MTTTGAACRSRARRCGSARRRRRPTRAGSRRSRRRRGGPAAADGRARRHGPLLAADGDACDEAPARSCSSSRPLLAGCGLGSGDAPSGGRRRGADRLAQLRRRGARALRAQDDPGRRDRDAPAAAQVRRSRRATAAASCRRSTASRAAGAAAGRSTGSIYVNGIEADSGAAARRLEPGDRVWWDHHDWGAAMRIPAVVGSFPEPFTSGGEGQAASRSGSTARRDSRRECREVRDRLEEAGAQVGGSGTLGTRAGPGVLRLLVGRWSEVRVDPTARRLEKGPKVSGVFARPARGRAPLRAARPARRARAHARRRARASWRRRASWTSSRRGS